MNSGEGNGLPLEASTSTVREGSKKSGSSSRLMVGRLQVPFCCSLGKELNIDLPYDPAIALLGIYPKDTDAMKRQDTCTPMFIAAMSAIAKLEGASVSIER